MIPQWLQSISNTSLNYGLDKINEAISYLVKLFFNSYGKKILKVENDKIIDVIYSENNFNICKIFPLKLLGAKQQIGLNIVKYIGDLNGIIIFFPWKQFLNKYTEIKIDTIDLTLNILKFVQLNQENQIAYDTEINNDLIDAYNEINAFVIQYIKKISIEILNTNIFLNSLKIKLNQIKYIDSIFTIGSIVIYHNDNILLELDTLILNKKINIKMIKIKSQIFNLLVPIYLENTKTNPELTVHLDVLVFDSFNIYDITFKSNNENIYIECKNINIDGVFFSESYEKILININENNIKFNSKINIYVENYNFVDIFSYLKIVACNIKKCFIYQDDKTITNIFNVNFLYSFIGNNYDITIEYIEINEYISCNNVKIECYNYVLTSQQVIRNNNITTFKDNCIKNETFNSKITFIKLEENEDIHFYFEDGNISDIIKFIDLIKNITNSFSNNNKNKYKTYLNIKNSTIQYNYNNEFIVFDIGLIIIDLTDKKMSGKFKMLLNNKLIANVDDATINAENININSITFYLTNDSLEYLLHVLINIKQKEEMIENKSLTESKIFELQNVIKTNIYDKQQKNIYNVFQPTKYETFNLSYVENYENIPIEKNNININIKFAHIKLFTKFDDINDKSFVSIIIKNFDLYKKEETITKLIQTKYFLKISQCFIINDLCSNLKFKYLLKNAYDNIFLTIELLLYDNSYKLNIYIAPFIVTIKESMTTKLVNFFTFKKINKNKQVDKYVYIRLLHIDKISIIVNYYPKFGVLNIFSIKNFKLNMSEINLHNMHSIDKTLKDIKNQWINDIKILNILPNVKIIKKILSPFITISKYLL